VHFHTVSFTDIKFDKLTKYWDFFNSSSLHVTFTKLVQSNLAQADITSLERLLSISVLTAIFQVDLG